MAEVGNRFKLAQIQSLEKKVLKNNKIFTEERLQIYDVSISSNETYLAEMQHFEHNFEIVFNFS